MVAEKLRIAAHVEVVWGQGETRPARCPNCGTAGPARQLIEIDYRPPDAVHRFILQICPHCGARFADNPETMDYGTDELIEIGWHTYQVQLGAGVWPIAAPLTRIDKPVGARMLEIGGAYGFGLDFGIRGRGWSGRGYDPSPLAAFGARELGLDIAQAYFGEADLGGGAYDVVLATEVVEHLAEPPGFFRLMRQAVGADGILLLTTPDAAWITPELSAAQLMPLLSPGAHLVLQTAQSLALALRAAGFGHVEVRREAMSLVAYASPAPFVLRDDAAAGRALYRKYLVERAKLTAPESDLRLGFAGRGLFEAANDRDAAPAAEAWGALLPAAQARFGLDLETMAALPAGAEGASLDALARLMPLGLGMILFGRAMQLLAARDDRAGLLPLFRLAIAAVDALQGALAQRSLGDGLSADIRRVAETECLICLADAGHAEAAPALIALARREPAQTIAAWRGLVGLVNAGNFAGATVLQTALDLDDPAALPADLRRDALLSLANLALAPGGATMRAFGYAAALKPISNGPDDITLSDAADDIVLQAFTRLANASRYDEALAVMTARDVEALAARAAGRASGHDARLARMVLDLAVGDPAEIPGRLRGLAIAPARREALLLEAFIRLVGASRYGEALDFIREHDVPALAARAEPVLRQDAALSRIVLDLAVGDPLAVPERLGGLAVEPARREALLLEAFVRLVNASRYDDAFGFIRDHDVAALAARAAGEIKRDAGLALTVLDLAAGDPAEVPARLEGLDIAPARREALLLQAYIRLVNFSRFGEAAAFAETHEIAALAARQGGAAGRDAALALAVADLAAGDPAAVPGRIALLPAGDERGAALLLGAFTGLVNAARYGEARALAEDHGIMPKLQTATGAAADDARIAAVLLAFEQGRTDEAVALILDVAARAADQAPEALDALYVDGFVRLVNEGRFAAARRLSAQGAVTRRLARCPPALRQDGLAAFLLQELQPGGEAARLPQLLDEVAASGLAEERVAGLAFAAFVTLVNGAEFPLARRLLPMVDPALLRLRPPYNETARNALFAAGVLALQERDEWRRSVAVFARLRDALVKLAPPGGTPDPLFWPALRGEILALHRLDRAADAGALLASFLPVYAGAPDDLREQAA